MDLNTIILAVKYSEKSLLETQIAHGKFVIKVAEITRKNNSELIKIINSKDYKKDVNLKDIVDKTLKICDTVSDTVRFGRGWMYYIDGERYRAIRDEETFKYFKRKCFQEFKKLSDPKIIQQFKEEMGSYLPKKYQ